MRIKCNSAENCWHVARVQWFRLSLCEYVLLGPVFSVIKRNSHVVLERPPCTQVTWVMDRVEEELASHRGWGLQFLFLPVTAPTFSPLPQQPSLPSPGLVSPMGHLQVSSWPRSGMNYSPSARSCRWASNSFQLGCLLSGRPACWTPINLHTEEMPS